MRYAGVGMPVTTSYIAEVVLETGLHGRIDDQLPGVREVRPRESRRTATPRRAGACMDWSSG
jgi:hypothetical protein